MHPHILLPLFAAGQSLPLLPRLSDHAPSRLNSEAATNTRLVFGSTTGGKQARYNGMEVLSSTSPSALYRRQGIW